jgi:hypothetical protein
MFDEADFDAIDFETGEVESPPLAVSAHPMFVYARTADKKEDDADTNWFFLLD